MPVTSRVTLLFAVALASAEAAFGLTVAERGRPASCAIVVESEEPSAAYAAQEFADYVRKLTDVALPIGGEAPRKVVLRTVADEALGEDGFRLAADARTLTVTGGKRGVLYGAYEVLQRFGGVEWFSSWCEEVPKIDRLEVPDGFENRQKPAFPVRESSWFDSTWHVEFAARMRLNQHTWRPPNIKVRLGGNAWPFGGELGCCHTFAKLLPPEKYFDAHPDWFSEVDGKRLKEKTQICLTNPGAIAEVTKNLREIMRQHPEAKCFGVSQEDWDNWCTCPDCRALDAAEGSHAGTMVDFVNKVAEGVEEEFPDKMIETLAYTYTRPPPKTIRPRRNVMICFCAMEIEYGRSILESNDAATKQTVREVRRWGELTDNLFVWDYCTDYTNYLMPFTNERQIQGNFRFYRDCGVFYLFCCGGGYHADFAELKNYLVCKWMWNPDLPAEKLIDRFFRGYYGAAAPYVRKYYDALVHHRKKAGNPRLGFYDPVTSLASVYPSNFFAAATRAWQLAEQAVLNDPVRLYNVKTSSLSTDYVNYMTRYRSVYFSENDRKKDTEGREALKRLVEGFRLAESNDHIVAICDGWERSNEKRRKIMAEADADKAVVGKRGTVRLEESDFDITGYENAHLFVDDPEAENGRAVVLTPGFCDWSTFFNLNRVAFRPGRKYRLSVRFKAKLTGAPGTVFEVIVFDHKTKTCAVRKSWTPKDIRRGYASYDVCDWVPERDQVMHLTQGSFDRSKRGTNPSNTGVWVDYVEIRELK